MRGDREVSGSSVCEGVCEAPTFTEWSTVMVSMYPEDSSRALKVYQEHQQVGRVAHQAPAFEIEGTIISRLRRPIPLEPSRNPGKLWKTLAALDEARTSTHTATGDRAAAARGEE